MNQGEFDVMLRAVNIWVLQHPDNAAIQTTLPEEVKKSQWLGYPGATEDDILSAERRLGVSLPPSYKDLLRVSNGFLKLSPILGPLLSTNELVWYSEENQEAIDDWMVDNQDDDISDAEYLVYGAEQWKSRTRFGYLQDALAITKPDDPTLLLNPNVVFPDGEWEVWSFGVLHAGARRYRSVGEALLDHLLALRLW